MAGIYIHIPFCKKACHYCNFHFSTSLRLQEPMVKGIIKEIELQKEYLNGAVIQSIYFGGGTPSLLNLSDINAIFCAIRKHYQIETNAEITLEANPDDLTNDKLEALRQSPINRLSIGIQSFSDEDLRFMNRAHNAEEAESCIEKARAYGFDNLTVDLIYGTPTMSDKVWRSNIEKVIALAVPHISCYCLTVEPNTALGHFVKTGKVPNVVDEQAAKQFELLMNTLENAGYLHYEISNFAKPDHFAIHNSNYWKRVPYLGVGPSAHSFDGQVRQWNIANNVKYVTALAESTIPFDSEQLTVEQQYNEYIMTSLRTIWGCNISKLNELGTNYAEYFTRKATDFVDKGLLKTNRANYTLTRRGKFLADYIAMELFWDN